jgi:uncharacterized membrane protein YkvA (DUF1232 family)
VRRRKIRWLPVATTLKARGRDIKSEVIALALAARHPGTPWYAKALLLAIVAYALSPIDLIPDFIPVLGFLDDVILVPLAINLAIKLIPAPVLAQCRLQASKLRTTGAWLGRIGAAFIVLLWLALLVWLVVWALSAARSR